MMLAEVRTRTTVHVDLDSDRDAATMTRSDGSSCAPRRLVSCLNFSRSTAGSASQHTRNPSFVLWHFVVSSLRSLPQHRSSICPSLLLLSEPLYQQHRLPELSIGNVYTMSASQYNHAGVDNATNPSAQGYHHGKHTPTTCSRSLNCMLSRCCSYAVCCNAEDNF